MLACCGQTLPLFHAVGDPYGEFITHFNVVHILWEQGQRETALQHMQTARDLKARIRFSTEVEDQ